MRTFLEKITTLITRKRAIREEVGTGQKKLYSPAYGPPRCETETIRKEREKAAAMLKIILALRCLNTVKWRNEWWNDEFMLFCEGRHRPTVAGSRIDNSRSNDRATSG